MSYVVLYGDRFDRLIAKMREYYGHLGLPDSDAEIIAMMTVKGFEHFLMEGYVRRTLDGRSDCEMCKHCERTEEKGEVITVICDQPLTDGDSEKAYSDRCPHYEEVD